MLQRAPALRRGRAGRPAAALRDDRHRAAQLPPTARREPGPVRLAPFLFLRTVDRRAVRRADREHGPGADRQPPRVAVPAVRLPGPRRRARSPTEGRLLGRRTARTAGRRISLADARDHHRRPPPGGQERLQPPRPRRWEMAVFRCPTGPKIASPTSSGSSACRASRSRSSTATCTSTANCSARHWPRPARRGCRCSTWLRPARRLDAPLAGRRRRCRPSGRRTAGRSTPWLTLDGERSLDRGRRRRHRRLATYWHDLDDSADRRGDPRRDRVQRAHVADARLPASTTSWSSARSGAAVAGTGASRCRLIDGADAATAEIAVGRRVGESGLLLTHDGGCVRTANRPPLEAGQDVPLEFAFVDRRASLAVDGKTYFPSATCRRPTAADVASPLQLGAEGCTRRRPRT